MIDHLRPQLVLLNAAAGNREAMPAPETLRALQAYPRLRTDENGWIHPSTEGERLWVEVERK